MPEASAPIDTAAMQRYRRAVNYLAAAQIYLKDNALLHEPLQPAHIKPRLLGHWGTAPGINLVYQHLNRLIAQTVSGRTRVETPDAQHQQADRLLKKRDQFIAQRINSTLGPGETGIIFIGMLHDLHGLIDQDIQILDPLKKFFSH
jgi:hypothetical protein